MKERYEVDPEEMAQRTAWYEKAGVQDILMTLLLGVLTVFIVGFVTTQIHGCMTDEDRRENQCMEACLSSGGDGEKCASNCTLLVQ